MYKSININDEWTASLFEQQQKQEGSRNNQTAIIYRIEWFFFLFHLLLSFFSSSIRIFLSLWGERKNILKIIHRPLDYFLYFKYFFIQKITSFLCVTGGSLMMSIKKFDLLRFSPFLSVIERSLRWLFSYCGWLLYLPLGKH